MKYNERGKSRIEVSDILNYFKDIDSYYNDCTRYDTLKRMLEDIVAETKEDAERKTGKWIEFDSDEDKYDIIKCPCCKHMFTVDSYHWTDIGFVKDDLKFCPNCGADMRGEGGKDG